MRRSDRLRPHRRARDRRDLDRRDLDGVAGRLVQALEETARDIEPRSDAYARLAARVNGELDHGPGGARSWRPSSRLALGAAFGTLMLAGLALAVPALNGDQTVSSAALQGGANQFDPGRLTSTSAPGAGPVVPDAPPASVVDLPVPGPVLGPRGDTPLLAAAAFLDQTGIAPGVLRDTRVTADGEVEVWSVPGGPGQSGTLVAVLDLLAVERDGDRPGWAVAQASSDQVSIDRVLVDGAVVTSPEAPVAGSELTVEGGYTGSAGAVDVELRAALLGTGLATATASAADGSGFTVTLPLAGTEQAWVVVRTASSGDGGLAPFAAVPVTYVGPADTRDYVVTRIPAADPDKGLRLRAGPGERFDVLQVVPRGDTVTRSPDDLPTRDGSSVWWPVTAADGATGWMSARYLAGDGADLDADQLRSAARDLLAVAADPARAGPWLPLSPVPLRVFADGVDTTIDGTVLHAAAGWREPVVGAGQGEPPRSMAEVLDVPASGLDDQAVPGEPELSPGSGSYLDEDTGADAGTYFFGLTPVTATYTGADGRGRVTHFYFESSPTGPRLAGLVAEVGEEGPES